MKTKAAKVMSQLALSVILIISAGVWYKTGKLELGLLAMAAQLGLLGWLILNDNAKEKRELKETQEREKAYLDGLEDGSRGSF